MPGKNISVVLTTCNGSKYIVKQIDSILHQTTAPDEIIICDDKSTDETVFLLYPYLTDSRIKLFVNDKRLGVIKNFKKAAALAKHGNWLAFADQDDIWLPEKLSMLGSAMVLIDDGTTPSLVYSDLIVIDKYDSVISPSLWAKQKFNPQKIKLSTLLYGNVIPGCSIMINCKLAEEFLLIDDGEYFHDEWLVLIAHAFGRAKYLHEALVLYRQHESNVTFSEDHKTLGFIGRIKEDLNYWQGKKKYLFRQFGIAKAFLLKYRIELKKKELYIVENFIKQENKNYITQRIKRRIICR